MTCDQVYIFMTKGMCPDSWTKKVWGKNVSVRLGRNEDGQKCVIDSTKLAYVGLSEVLQNL